MADRRLAVYEEERRPEGPHWTLEFERAASGPPTVFVTTRFRSVDGTLPEVEQTVVVRDFPTVVAPVLAWADPNEPGARHLAAILSQRVAAAEAKVARIAAAVPPIPATEDELAWFQAQVLAILDGTAPAEPEPEGEFWDDRTTPLAYSRSDAEHDEQQRRIGAQAVLAEVDRVMPGPGPGPRGREGWKQRVAEKFGLEL